MTTETKRHDLQTTTPAQYAKAGMSGLWRPGIRRSANVAKPVFVPENIEALAAALRDAICWHPVLHGADFEISLMDGKPTGTFRFEDGRTAWAKVSLNGDLADDWAEQVAATCALIMPKGND